MEWTLCPTEPTAFPVPLPMKCSGQIVTLSPSSVGSKCEGSGRPHCLFNHKPKQWQIFDAPIRDGSVQHSLTGVDKPIFLKTFIPDSNSRKRGQALLTLVSSTYAGNGLLVASQPH